MYWGKCVLHAAYLINRTPNPLLANKTLFEVLFNKAPSFTHINVFGCHCYATNLRPTHEFDVHATPYIFLGYPPHQKSFKLHDPSINKFIVSRDVFFHEDVFLFVAISTSSALFLSCSAMTSTYVTSFSHVPIPLPSSPSPSTSIYAPRQSSRQSKPPIWSKDFICSAVSNSSSSNQPYDLSKYHGYAHVSLAHRSFLASISHLSEPTSFKAASFDPRWQRAMAAEIEALEANKTLTIVPLPPGKKSIGCRWIYKIKYNADCSVNKFKARLVVKGYTQQYGIDYHGTFFLVAKIVIVRYLLSIATAKR